MDKCRLLVWRIDCNVVNKVGPSEYIIKILSRKNLQRKLKIFKKNAILWKNYSRDVKYASLNKIVKLPLKLIKEELKQKFI